MARAWVELIGSASYTINQRKFTKNSPQLLTDSDEILFFQNRPGFRVRIEQDAPRTSAQKKVEVKKLDKELEKITKKPKPVVAKKEPPKKESSEVTAKYTKEKLLAFKKAELSRLADEMGIVFDGPAKRLKLIGAILKKQEG